MMEPAPLWATILCVGCGGAQPRPGDAYTVLIESTFTTDERAGIDVSIQDWMANVPVTLDVIAGSCDSLTRGVICLRAVDHAEILRHVTQPLSTTLDCTTRSDSDGAIVYLDSSHYGGQDLWKYAVTHELGHAMGLKHDRDNTIMCWDSTCGAVNVTDADALQWKSLR